MAQLPANIEALRTQLTQARTRIQTAAPGGDFYYAKMDKNTGEWLYGQDNTEIEADSLWAVNPGGFATGYIAWDRNTSGPPKGEEMRAAHEPAIIKSDLPNVGAEWQEQASLMAVCVSGEDKGTVILWKSSAYGALKCIRGMLDTIVEHLAEEPNTPVPLVKFTHDSYKHKKYGRILEPVLEIVKWAPMDATEVDLEEDEPEETEVEEAPRRRRRAAR